ncbi:MAG: hypothetical protein FJW36_15590 [Acidobacteria bacterium]|nr:hypothetical protein [Acidobacteriota bacterium]
MADTDQETLEVYAEMMRGMSVSQRMTRVFELNQMQRAMMVPGVRAQYPEADDNEVFLRVASRILDREQMIAVYGWDPALHS